MIRTLLFIVVMGLCPTVMAQTDESVDLDALYRQIDDAISQSPTYVAERERKIADWRNRLNNEKNVEKSVQMAEELFHLYQPYRNDSALYYAEVCIAIADSLRRPDLAGRFRSMLAYQLSDADMFTESLEELRTVNKSVLDSVGLVNYYHAWMHVYGELGSKTQRPAIRLKYFGLQDAYRDSVLMVADEGSEEWLHLKVDILCARQLYQDALELSSEWLQKVTDGTHESAYAAFYRSMVYGRLKNHDQTCYWMGKSALDDIRCAVMNQASLLFLA
jgi:AAA+ ATPase superfamily predicted ATPase